MVDYAGQVWGGGTTNSLDLPVLNAWQPTNHGGFDGFVYHLSVDGSTLLDLSYLGGSSDEQVAGVAIQGFGAVVVCGASLSADFPVSSGALSTPPGSDDSVNAANALGVTQGDPGAAQTPAGDTVVVAGTPQDGLWLNVYLSVGQSWKGWVSAGSSSTVNPGAAAGPDGTVWIAMRDAANSYRLRSYRTDTGFGGAWTSLGGAFSTDPAIAVATDGSSYIIGAGLSPNQGQVSSGRYVPGSGFGGWVVGTTTGAGKPAVTAGSDGAVYVAIRYADGTNGMARRAGNTWGQWYGMSKAMSSDPQLAAANGLIYVAEVDSVNRVWANAFAQGAGNGWYGWADTRGWAYPVAIATLRGQFYIVGRDLNQDVWWYRSGVGWIYYQDRRQSVSNFVAVPR